jgi:glutamyl-tRNA reductase
VKIVSVSFPFRTVPVALREKLALTDTQRDATILAAVERFKTEVMVLSTCNRVEMTLAWPASTNSEAIKKDTIVGFFAERQQVNSADLEPLVEWYEGKEAIRHVGRVAASLDSLVIGEGQIAAQLKTAFEASQTLGVTGPILNTLIPHSLRTAKRVRTETGLAKGHISISSVAVDFAKQVFDRFDDKNVLVIGAGKMAGLTLKHLQALAPREIVLVNRSIEKAQEMANQCQGRVLAWEELAKAIAQADVVLSATGATTAIVTKPWFDQHVKPIRKRGPLVVLDIAVPRDFDAEIHDGSGVCVFNVDDLTRVREQMLAERKKHISPAEAIVESESNAFIQDWERRRSGPVIRELTLEFDRIRSSVVSPLLSKWNGKLSQEEKLQLEYAFKLFQSQLLHGPIAALHDASKSGEQRTMLDAIKKLFKLNG